MNIEIDDVIITRLIYDEFTKLRTRSMFGSSNLEDAVKKAVMEVVKDRIIESIKADAELMTRLTKELSIQLEERLGELGKRIAGAISSRIIDAMGTEFKTYGD